MVPPKKKPALKVWRWLVLLPIPALWCVAAHFGWLDVLENQFLRLRYHVRGEIAAPVKIAYVDIDTAADQQLGERPWARGDFALAARSLLEDGRAKAVGFDFVFSDLSASKLVPRDEWKRQNFEFGKVTRYHPEVVLGAQYSGGQAYVQAGRREFPLLRQGHTDPSKNDLPELPVFPLMGNYIDRTTHEMKFWGTVGLIDVDYGYGGDEVPRWVPLFAQTPNGTFYHLALQLALIDLGLDASAIKLGRNRLDLVRPDGSVATSIPLREHQLIEVNWFSKWLNPSLNPRTSLAEVLLYKQDLASDKPEVRTAAEKFFSSFAGAIVLIGPVDPLLQDLAPTPFDSAPVPKVGLHGNLIKTICSGLFIRRLPEWAAIVLTFLLTLVVASLSVAGGVRSLWNKIAAAVLLFGFVAAALVAFKFYHYVLPMAVPLGATLTTTFVAVGWQLAEEEKRAGRIKGMFGTYLAPAVVDAMVESGKDPELGGHDAEITAYFSDIQSFSSFSEILSSSKLTELLNEYLTACTDIVQGEGGSLDKYIGDAVVAMYGAPVELRDHALRACIATQLVQKRIGELRAKWESEGDKWPPLVHHLRTRIGLNTGVCMIGNMGSRTRFNYTMMGDNVNLAARMESGAKSWGVYTMCTETTKLACEQQGGDRVVFRALGRIVVKGRSQPVPIYEIVGLKEDVTAAARECFGLFEAGLAQYYARDWIAALALFAQSRALEPNQPGRDPGVASNPSLVYLDIVAHFQHEPPPENWDGVYVMKEK